MVFLIGETHYKEADEKFAKLAKEKANQDEIILLLENDCVEFYLNGEISKNVYAAEIDIIHFYTSIIVNAGRLYNIKNKNTKDYEISLQALIKFITYLWNGLLHNEDIVKIIKEYSYLCEPLNVIPDIGKYNAWRSVYNVFSQLNNILEHNCTTNIELLSQKLICNKLAEFNELFRKIAIKICSLVRDEKYSYPDYVKDHTTIDDNWVNSFFNCFSKNTKPDTFPILVGLRNKIFAHKIVQLSESFSDKNIWFIVGSTHLEGLKSELVETYQVSNIEIVQRKEKWCLVDMETPPSSPIRLSSLDDSLFFKQYQQSNRNDNGDHTKVDYNFLPPSPPF